MKIKAKKSIAEDHTGKYGGEITSSRGGSLAVKKFGNTLCIDHIHGTVVLMEETSEYSNAETNMNFAPIGVLFGAKH